MCRPITASPSVNGLTSPPLNPNKGDVEFTGFSGDAVGVACESASNWSGLRPPRWLAVLVDLNDGFDGRRTVPPGTPAQLRARRAIARLAAQRHDVIPTNVVQALPSNSCQQWRHLNAEPHSQRDRSCLTLPPCFGSAGRRTRPWQPPWATSSRLAVQSIAVHSTVFAAVPMGRGLGGVPYAVAG